MAWVAQMAAAVVVAMVVAMGVAIGAVVPMGAAAKWVVGAMGVAQTGGRDTQ